MEQKHDLVRAATRAIVPDITCDLFGVVDLYNASQQISFVGKKE